MLVLAPAVAGLVQLTPFMEQGNWQQQGAGLSRNEQLKINSLRIGTPMPWSNCPTRRNGGPYPNHYNYTYFNAKGVPPWMARSDYAANAGDNDVDQFFAGPDSLAQGDNPKYNWPSVKDLNGVIFQRSEIRIADMTNGTSNTYLVGEKYLNPVDYDTGSDLADNENQYVGFDNDINRCTANPPMRDTPKVQNYQVFGSAHAGGCNMLYCDGRVEFVAYTVDKGVHKRAGNRH